MGAARGFSFIRASEVNLEEYQYLEERKSIF